MSVGGNSMKPSSLMLAAACIAILPVTINAQDGPSPYSANEVMKGCRAFIAKTKWEREASDAFFDAFIRGICVGTVSTLAVAAASLERAAGVCMPERRRLLSKFVSSPPTLMLGLTAYTKIFASSLWKRLKTLGRASGRDLPRVL
jgi:hypothetical protein